MKHPLGWLMAALALIVAVPAMAQDLAHAPLDQHAQAIIDCDALGKVDFSQDRESPAAITGAKLVPANGGTNEYCAITGYVQPQVQFEVRLPTKGWNGRYFQIGCGGINMSMQIGNLPVPTVRKGMELFRDRVLPQVRDL